MPPRNCSRWFRSMKPGPRYSGSRICLDNLTEDNRRQELPVGSIVLFPERREREEEREEERVYEWEWRRQERPLMDRKRGERVPESALNRTRTQSGWWGLLYDQVSSWKLVKRAEDRLTFRMADLRINEFAGWACERDWIGWMEIFQCTTDVYL